MDDYEVLQQLRLRQQKSELDELKPASIGQATFFIASTNTSNWDNIAVPTSWYKAII